MGYLGYYFAWLAFSYLIREPWLLVGLVALYFVRGFLPPPGAVFGALGRAGRLREQVRLNRANITARRDLASVYLSLLRPRRAIPLLEEGLALAPEDAELMYLLGVALHRAGRHEEALVRLLAALERDARLRHGQPYFVAGETLLALERWDDATDAFERYLDFNGSDVAAHTCLARARAGAKAPDEAQKSLLAGIATWHGLPSAMKRRQFGAYLRGQWARVVVLRDVGAMLFAGLLLLLLAGSLRAAYPLVSRLWEPSAAERYLAQVRSRAALCGTQRTGDFAGAYAATPEPPDGSGAAMRFSKLDPEQLQRWQQQMAPRFADFRVEPDRIVMGSDAQLEYCLTRVFERTPGSLHAEAVLRVREPVGAAELEADGEAPDEPALELFDIHLERGADGTRFSFAPLENKLAPTLVSLRRLD